MDIKMTYPVTGPHTTVRASGLLHEDKIVGYRQRRPYDLVLPLRHERYWWSSGPAEAGSMGFLKSYSEPRDGSGDRAYARAYSSLVGKLGETASIGVSLAQYSQAKGMIVKRANTLLSFGEALVRRSPIGVARALSISVLEAQRVFHAKRRGVKRQGKYAAARPLADLWLEFWFGWKPAVQDIYSACEVLSNPLPSTRIRGTGVDTSIELGTDRSPAVRVTSWQQTNKVSMGADVAIANPNLRLFQQLGLLNPYVVAFDTIPWSFVLGWFSNINSYLSAFTDFAGLDIRRSYISRLTVTGIQTRWNVCDPCTGIGTIEEQWAQYLSWTGNGTAIVKTRSSPALNVIPYPPLVFSSKELQPSRALTAISLLVQKLPRL